MEVSDPLQGDSYSTLELEEEMIKPIALKPGDTIALMEIGTPLKDRTQKVKACQKQLQELGFKVYLASNFNKPIGRFVGTDKERAEAFMKCFSNPEIKMIWFLRGGEGGLYMLNHIDFGKIIKSPKIVLGMSDPTTLHVALNNRNMVTFLGSLVNQVVDVEGEESQRALEQVMHLVSGKANEASWIDESIQIIRGGKARGRLVGGNLSIIAASIGTPYQIQTKGKVLVLEDVEEPVRKIERFLWQLEEAHLLDDLAGVILGIWTGCEIKELMPVFDKYFSNKGYPVICGFRTGHIKNQITLPLNCLVELDADSKSVKVLENCVAL